jgi:hypothetical protein
MPDALVYYFLFRERSTGRLVRSKSPATLAAIKGRGEPVLESQMAVDESEIDALGFLVCRSVRAGDPAGELWSEIRSLRLRAASRERQAKQLDVALDRERELILRAESQELRTRADWLQQQVQKQKERASGEGIYSVASAGESENFQFLKPE